MIVNTYVIFTVLDNNNNNIIHDSNSPHSKVLISNQFGCVGTAWNTGRQFGFRYF